jgi:broad specificity phosphatase PhoE
MRAILPIIFSFILLFASGCREDQPQQTTGEDSPVTTFYLIRHAEKDRTNPEDIDPELNQEGLGRAMHWAEILNEVALDAIYSTDFERTNMTAAPASVKQDITVQYYDPDELNTDQFVTDNIGKNVLVVGHSDTTPALVNKLLGEEKYGKMDDDDNGSLYIVQLIGGKISDMRLIFNCHCPD